MGVPFPVGGREVEFLQNVDERAFNYRNGLREGACQMDSKKRENCGIWGRKLAPEKPGGG